MSGGAEQERGGTPSQDDRVEVNHEGRVVARADIVSPAEPHGTAKVALQTTHDDAPPDARGQLVDRVMDHPAVRSSDTVHVVLPLGDSESISRLQEHTTNFTAHAAGSSSVIEADVPRPAEDA